MSMSTVSEPRDAPSNKKPSILSCAECRRLKLKCSRVWPCSSCQKRGLAELCPSGSLATRPRHKPPPPTPQHVVERIRELQARVNELEAALATLQATISDETHPLLRNDTQTYLQKKLMRKVALEKVQEQGVSYFDETPAQTNDASQEENDETEDVVASLGTLKITSDGRSVFYGPSAVSEGLSVEEPVASLPDEYMYLAVDIATLSQSFPFTSPSHALKALQERAKSHIPSQHRAEEHCATYFKYANFVLNIVPEDDWFEALFCRLYGANRSCRSLDSVAQDEQAIAQTLFIPAEELSLFFCIMAIGAVLDLSAEPYNAEAETYYHISRALMTTRNVLTEPTLASVQTTCLASYYEGLRSRRNSSRDCWILMVLSNKTAQIMGLHRDHSMFGLGEQDIQRRRLVFWEAHTLDMIESLALGRPISTPVNYTDTHMPVDTLATTNIAGETEESFYHWKYRFCADVVTMISDLVLRVKRPSYTQILDADRKMRRFISTFGRGHLKAQQRPSPAMAAQIQMMLGTKETCMLYIHRGFFAHALSMELTHPEQSKYGRSVLAAYESACIIVQGMHTFVGWYVELAARIWFLWNHLMSASFVLGSIVIRAPSSSLAATSLAQLDVVEKVLIQAAVYGGRAEYMLPIVESLRTKGHNARMEYQTGSSPKSPSVSNGTEEDNDELAVIGGKTRLVVSKQSSVSPPSSESSVPHSNTTRGSTSTPTSAVHLPFALEGKDLMSEFSDVYPAYPLVTPTSPKDGQGHELYWPFGEFMPSQHSGSGADLAGSPFFYPQGTGESTHDTYPQMSQQLLDQQDVPMSTEDIPGIDSIPDARAWQTLVADLGITGM